MATLQQLQGLESRLAALENRESWIVCIDTLASDHHELIRPFHVTVRSQGDDFIALFADAALSASGDTAEDAILNLKDVITATFDAFSELSPSELGPVPAKQIKVLRQFIRRLV